MDFNETKQVLSHGHSVYEACITPEHGFHGQARKVNINAVAGATIIDGDDVVM